MNADETPWWSRIIIRILPEKWLQRIDDWAASNSDAYIDRPDCPWRSVYGRPCVLAVGHRGVCVTSGPGQRRRYWYGINYEMIEGIPFPKGR